MYVNLCDTYKVTGINHVSRRSVRILFKRHFMLLAYINVYGFHIGSILHTVLILYEHIDRTCLHICATMQPTATSISQIIAIHVPEANKPANLYHIFDIHVLRCMGIYVPSLADPGRSWGPGPPYPQHVGIFKAKEFTMSANQGQISAGPPTQSWIR